MKRKKINSKSLAIIFSTLLLFTISLFLIFDPNYHYSNKIDKTEVLEGTEDDNWEISVVFYDLSDNDSNTPLTEINWHAMERGKPKSIKAQINYKNTNTQRQYDPGKVQIRFNYLKCRNYYGPYSNYSRGIPAEAVSAGSLENGYDWNYSSGSGYYTFTNNTTIEKNTNIEGSIQLVYKIYPSTYFGSGNGVSNFVASTFINGSTDTLKATLLYDNKEVLSNDVKFTFTSEQEEYTISNNPNKITALDGLENPNDYIWIKWEIGSRAKQLKPKLAQNIYIKDYIPEGAVVYDSNLERVETNNNYFIANGYSDYNINTSSVYDITKNYFIGYPKEIYEGLNITNKAEIYGTYDDDEEVSLLNEDEKTVNLDNYSFSYSGELYSIEKEMFTLYTARANNNYETRTAYIKPRAIYTGTTYDLIMSDDFMLIPMADGTHQILDDSQYNVKKVYVYKNNQLENGNNKKITGNKIEIYVRYSNTTEFVKYPEYMILGEKEEVEFSEDNIAEAKIIIKDLNQGIGSGTICYDYQFHTSGIADSGLGYNFTYIQIKQGNEIVNTPTISSYNNLKGRNKLDIAEYDIERYGTYMQRAVGEIVLQSNKITYGPYKILWPSPANIPSEELFKISARLEGSFSTEYGYIDEYYGQEIVDLLPEGMEVYSTKEEIYNTFANTFLNYYQNAKYKLSSGRVFNGSTEFWDYYKDHLEISIINNYRNTNRTLLKIKQDFTDDPLVISINQSEYKMPPFAFDLYFSVSYDSIAEFGNHWENTLSGFILRQDKINYRVSKLYSGEEHSSDPDDINDNGITNEFYYDFKAVLDITYAIESHQDVQTQVQSDISNFDTGKVNVSKNGEYTYKLRVRTGQNDVTNLIIYDSIEDYAKNPQLEIVKASGGKHYWQGEFQGVDTSYAESKGYQIKTYYNTNPNPGTLAEDNTWQEYNDSVDKSKVKALAFKYLDGNGNPAILPANTNTYVLLKMKSPNDDYKTFSYNGCWTEWNAIDSVTGRPVDFVTGINSNIVKVALPTSVEPEDINITIKKEWKDGNNTLGVRPNTINVKLIANDDYTNAVEVPMTGTGNSWTTTVTVPRYDEDGESINYTVKEDNITVGEYHYSSTVNNYTITNSLNRDLTLTKVWKDNTNAYLTRPSNVTFKIKQNNSDYKTVTFGGNLTDNEWTETITVPVYDNNGTAYNYTVEEINVSNYSSTCTEFTCTNTLTGNDNITITKVWVDNNNEYQTRPNNISIRLKQNGNAYQSIDLTGTTNTWASDEITVPMYDNEGVKYTYTVEETPISGYGIVEYDQADLKVTNTLNENKAITITKKWIDNSNSLGLRPNELKINLLQNGNNYQEITLSGTTDTWSTTIEVPKYDNNQHEYTYSIKELVENINDDYSNISYSEEELSVTNKLEAKTNITISKIWEDNDNELKTRPDKITINLLRNGEQFQELEIVPDDIQDNTWSVTVEDLDVYDNNGAKYTYTIEESLIDQLERYETITYDQTNFKITNKLTVPPKVTLFFTVKNGYTLPGTEEILYDQEGYNEVLSRYNLNGEDEYIFNFELENIDTGEVIAGKLSTQGTLEFDDVPYGTYRAREGEDDYFSFVSMIEIEEVLGVTFTEDEMGGTISITPTGKDIIYGANITNKIEIPPKNPETKTNNSLLIISIIILTISLLLGITVYKKFSFLKA